MKRISAYFEKAFAKATASPVAAALVVFLLAAAAIIGLSYAARVYDKSDEFIKNVLAGAHNTLMEILVVGVVILWLTKIGERRIENQRYFDEIEELRNSNSMEGLAVIRRNILRLNANGWHDFNLSGYKLDRLELGGADLRASRLLRASFFKADLGKADLSRADLTGADLREASLRGARLDHALLVRARLDGADLTGASLRGTNLDGANVVSVCWDGAVTDGSTILPYKDFKVPGREVGQG